MPIIAPNLQLNAGVHRSPRQAPGPFKSTSDLLETFLGSAAHMCEARPSMHRAVLFLLCPARSGHLCLSSFLSLRTPPHSPQSPALSGREVGALDHPGISRACFLQLPSSGGTLPSLPSQLATRSLCFLWSVENGPQGLPLHKQGWLGFLAHFRLAVSGVPCP